MVCTTYRSPLGDIELVAGSRGLRALRFACHSAGAAAEGSDGACVDPASLFGGAYARKVDGSDAESGSAPLSADESEDAAAISVIERTWGWLNSYFAGQGPLWLPPLDIAGDEFSHRVLVAVLGIPRGETETCAQIAVRLGSDFADVASAIEGNPVQIIIPTHRVVVSRPGALQKRLFAFER